MLIFFAILQAPHTKLPPEHTIDLLNALDGKVIIPPYQPIIIHLATICALSAC